MQWSEKLSEQTALTGPKELQKYNIRDVKIFDKSPKLTLKAMIK